MMKKRLFSFCICSVILVSGTACSKGDLHTEEHTVETAVQQSSGTIQSRKLRVPYNANADLCLYKGYYYYNGILPNGEGHILKLPQSCEGEPVSAYQFEKIEDPYREEKMFYPTPSFFEVKGKLFCRYHYGGATMGYDAIFVLSDKGVFEALEINSSYPDVVPYKNGMVIADHSIPPGPGNLFYQKDMQSDLKRLGSSEEYYACYRTVDSKGISSYGGSSFDVVGDWVYASVSSVDQSQGYISKINIETNEIVKISSIPVKTFCIDQKRIFFNRYEDSVLYQCELDGEHLQKLTDSGVELFDISNGMLWYTECSSGNLYRYDLEKHQAFLVSSKNVGSVMAMDKYVAVTLLENDILMTQVYDVNDKLVFESKESVNPVAILGDELICNYQNGDVCAVKLTQ